MERFCEYFHYTHLPGYVFYGHRHTEWELNIVLSGCMEITSDGNVERLFSGEAILIRANDMHQNRVIGDRGAEMLAIHFIPDRSEVCKRGVYKLSQDALSITHLLINEAERGGIAENEVKIISENSKKLLELFLAEIGRGERTRGNYNSRDAVIYRTAVEFMKQSIDKSLTIADISRTAGVCKTTVKKIFAYYTGMGCIQFFGEMKLGKAKRLIEEGQSCSAVADALGYSSLAYFSKKYKELYGHSPSKPKS